MKAISKILSIVSLTVISFAGNAQEVKKEVMLREPVKRVVCAPRTPVSDSKVEKVESQPVTKVQSQVRRIEPAKAKELKTEGNK